MSADTDRELIRRAGRGGAWLFVGRFGQSGLRLVSNVILAHLLFPEAFGLMGMVSILLMGLSLFSDTGIGPSIVRSDHGEDPRFLQTAWTVQALRGMFLFVLCILLAGPYSRLYDEPQLAQLIPFAGLISLFQGLRSTSLALADRKVIQGRKIVLGFVSQAVGAVAMVISAWITRSVFALLVGNIVSTGMYSLMSHTSMPGVPVRFRLDREALKELFGFGRWILFSTALFFLSMQGDRLFLGYILPLKLLGFYFMANSLVELITHVLNQVSNTVVFPTWVASARLGPEGHVERLASMRKALNALGLSGLLIIAVLAPALFRLLYDERYQGVPTLVQLICIPAWFLTLQLTASSALLAYGNSRALSISNFCLLLAKIPACVNGFFIGGIHGFILGSALGITVGLIPMYSALAVHGCRLRRTDVLATLKAFGLATVGIFIPQLASHQSVVPLLLIELVVAALVAWVAVAPARILLQMARK